MENERTFTITFTLEEAEALKIVANDCGKRVDYYIKDLAKESVADKADELKKKKRLEEIINKCKKYSEEEMREVANFKSQQNA